jgi:hypothetical protein
VPCKATTADGSNTLIRGDNLDIDPDDLIDDVIDRLHKEAVYLSIVKSSLSVFELLSDA